MGICHATLCLFRLSLCAAVLLCCGVATPGLRAQTYSDNTFNNADWVSIVMPCSVGGTSVTAAQDAIQGNPASSRTITHNYPGGNPGILVAHVRQGMSYDPATQGAIASINYSYDLRHYTGPAIYAVGYSPLLVQNGSYYRLNAVDAVNPNAWTPFSGTNLTAANFVKICGAATDHPDFSCQGSRIEFGYATNNSDPVVGRPTQARSSGIDNWSITVVLANTIGIDARPRTPICIGDTVTLIGVGGVTYHWRPTAGLSCVDCPVTKVSPTVTTTFYVDGVDANGCNGRDSVVITVNRPRTPVRTNVSVCTGDNIILPSDASTQYKWSPSAGLSCDTCRNPFTRPTANSLYTVTLRDLNGCITTDTVYVTLRPKPVVTLADSLSICLGDSVMLNVAGAGAGSVYRWTPTTGLGCTGCARPMASPDSTTLYHVRVTEIGGCFVDDSVLVVVRRPPTILVRIPRTLAAPAGRSINIPVLMEGPLDTGMVDAFDLRMQYDPKLLRVDRMDLAGTLCAGWAVTSLTVDPLAGSAVARLTAPSGATLAGAGLLANFVGTTFSSLPDTTPLPVSISFPRKHCLLTTTEPGLLRVSCLAAAVTAEHDTAICAGDSVRISASGGVAYQWSPAVGLSCTNCAQPMAAPSVSTTYTVDAVDVNGCHGFDSVRITVYPIRTATRSDFRLCNGDTVVLPCGAGISYRWAPSAGLDCDTCRNPVARPTATTIYTVVVDNGGGCLTVDTVGVVVNQPPKVTVTGNATLCLGDSTVLTASGGSTYQWSPTAGLSCTDCASPTAAPLATTTYVVDVVDANGCRGSGSIQVTVARPRAATRADIALCAGDSSVLPCAAGVSYRWAPSAGLSCDTCRNPIANPSVSTVYTVVVSNGGSCLTVDTVSVVRYAPVSIKASDDAAICLGDTTVLSAVGGNTYQWSPATGLSCATCSSPLAYPTATTLYRVHAIDANGCTADDSVLVMVNTPPTITARIARDLFARPGERLRFPVMLEGQPAPGTIDQFDIGVSYSPDLLRVDSLVLAGSLCNGWTLSNLRTDRVAGRTDAHLTAPPGGSLQGNGPLLFVWATAYLGSADTMQLPLSFATPGVRCVILRTEPGLLRLDSICGLSFRLIEWIKGSYSLDGNHPNPFNPSTTITFSLGLDGPTTLDVYNAAGRKVATLVNAHLEAGRYQVVWDASEQPSGVYYYHVRSGAWSRRATMVLMK